MHLSLVSYDSKLMEKIIRRSTDRHNNDVIIQKSCVYVQNEIPYKTYISDFSYFKNCWNGAVWNLFMERPSHNSLIDSNTYTSL